MVTFTIWTCLHRRSQHLVLSPTPSWQNIVGNRKCWVVWCVLKAVEINMALEGVQHEVSELVDTTELGFWIGFVTAIIIVEIIDPKCVSCISKCTNILYYPYIPLMAFFPGQPWYAGTRKVNHSGFYWSKR